MSHIHVPDGVLPAWLWVSAWVAALALVWVASVMSGRREQGRKVALLGVVSALMLVAMSSEIVPIAYHINLTVLAGLLLGPWLGIIAAFIVVVVLALLGHGGVTVIGLNTLLIGGEIVLGWALARLLMGMLGKRRTAVAAFLATVITLAATTTLLVGVVWLAGGGAATTRETGALDPSTLRFADPFAEGVFSINTLEGEEPPAPAGVGERAGGLSVRRFAAVVYTLGPLGWLIEALATAGIVRYVSRTRPALLAAERRHRHAPRGDDGEH